jgi:hypothetical protein
VQSNQTVPDTTDAGGRGVAGKPLAAADAEADACAPDEAVDLAVPDAEMPVPVTLPHAVTARPMTTPAVRRRCHFMMPTRIGNALFIP